MMRFLVTNRYQIRQLQLNQPYAVISITDPFSPPVVLPEHDLRLNMMRLEFYDLDRPFEGISDRVNDRLFTFDQADAVLQFAQKLEGQDVVIVCQCEAGISRSAAVAAALSRIYNAVDSDYFKLFHPNRRVYSMILSRHYELSEKSASHFMRSVRQED